MVEGFDSGLQGVENPLGEASYFSFRNETDFDTGGLPAQLNTYDIIYINFKKGSDDLRRNAYLVEDVIKWVNSVKVGTIPNVVLGQSMGGLLARYALRDMENQFNATGNTTWQHKTNLYISHDAPHQGANIPLSVLAFARHMIDQFVSTPLGDFNINITGEGAPVTIQDMQTLLNATGTKQLLLNNLEGTFSLNNTIGNAWRTELRTLGYPTLTRNIAISNGSHCAITQPFQPLNNLFTLTGTGQTALLTDLIMFFTPLGLYSSIGLAVLFNEPGLLIGMLPGNSKFNLNFYGKALPFSGGTNRVYNGRISFTKTLFRLFSWAPRITVNITDKGYDAPGVPSYDYFPGGAYNSFLTSGNSTSNPDFAFLGTYGINLTALPSFNFIPTTSALDIGNGLVTLSDADYIKKYTSAVTLIAPKTSPFANYTTSFNNNGINERHISFNRRNGDWLASELDNNANNNIIFDCTYICADNQITGANNLCTSATFSAPSGGTFNNWSITQGANLVSLSGNGTPNATLTALPDVSGAVTLSLTMGDDPLNNNSGKCGNITIVKTIWVGKPSFTFEYTYFDPLPVKSTLCAVSDVPNLTLAEQGVTNVVYTTSNNALISNWGGPYCVRRNNVFCIKATATNACGSTTFTYDCDFFRTANNNIFKIYPNPSNDIVNIEIRDANNTPEKGTTISGELFDMMGQSKSKVEITNNKATFSVRGLNKGIYILKIYINNQVESHQIAVE